MHIAKLKRQAQLFIAGTILSIIALFLYLLVTNLSYGFPQITPAFLLMNLPTLALTALSILHAILLLRSIAKEEVPFTLQNVRHLQWIGWLFIAYEPVAYVIQILRNRYFPITFDNGVYVTSFMSYGGIFLIYGFVILSVSAIFRYGMELQQLSDETL